MEIDLPERSTQRFGELQIFEHRKELITIAPIYARALHRLVVRCDERATPAGEDQARGRRRLMGRPSDRTIHNFKNSIGKLSNFSVGRYGRVLPPDEVTETVAREFATWLRDPRSVEFDHNAMLRYQAMRYGRHYGPIFDTMVSIYEPGGKPVPFQEIFAAYRARGGDLSQISLHKAIRSVSRICSVFMATPSARDVRKKTGKIHSELELDPNTYSYVLVPPMAIQPATIRNYLQYLATIWTELADEAANNGQSPIKKNPFSKIAGEWQRRQIGYRSAKQATIAARGITTPIALSLLRAAEGTSVSNKRDVLALRILLMMGLRAEEIVGLQRRDITGDDKWKLVKVVGKGNKQRVLYVPEPVLGAMADFDAALRDLTKDVIWNGDQLISSMKAKQALALLEDDAPVIPSLSRWGINGKPFDAAEAKMPMDTDGLRTMVANIKERACVRDIATGTVRKLSDVERKRIHLHAFRHYFATAAAAGGTPPFELKEVLGHSSVSTTGRYIDAGTGQSMAASVAVQRILRRQSPLSTSELKELRTARSPLEEPGIAEADPIDVAPVSTEEIEPPKWAYDGETTEAFCFAPLCIGTQSKLAWTKIGDLQVPLMSRFQLCPQFFPDPIMPMLKDHLRTASLYDTMVLAEALRVVASISVRFERAMAITGDTWEQARHP